MSTQTQVGDSADLSQSDKKDITFLSQIFGGAAAIGAFLGAVGPHTYGAEGTLMDSVIGAATGIPKSAAIILATGAAGAGCQWLGGKLSDIFGLEADSSTRKFLTDWSAAAGTVGGTVAGITVCAGGPGVAVGLGVAGAVAATPMVIGAFFAGAEKLIKLALKGVEHLDRKPQNSPSAP